MLLHAFQAAAGAKARVQVVFTTHLNLTRIKDSDEKQYGIPGACIVGEHVESKGAVESSTSCLSSAQLARCARPGTAVALPVCHSSTSACLERCPSIGCIIVFDAHEAVVVRAWWLPGVDVLPAV